MKVNWKQRHKTNNMKMNWKQKTQNEQDECEFKVKGNKMKQMKMNWKWKQTGGEQTWNELSNLWNVWTLTSTLNKCK